MALILEQSAVFKAKSIGYNWFILQRRVGDNCKVSDPLFNYQFDLTPLKKSNTNYQPVSGNYLLNVCGPLSGPPANCGATDGACSIKDGYGMSLGKKKILIFIVTVFL